MKYTIVVLLSLLVGCGGASLTPPTAVSVTSMPTTVPASTPTEEPSARYLRIAQDGATPVVRSGLPQGEWKSTLVDINAVQITYPLTVGTSNEQIVWLGRVQGQGIIKRLFDAAPELMSVNTVGTLPDGSNGTELAAISIVVKREALKTWDGTPDTIGEWNVSPRLR
jgi:hypothetical protein